METISFSALCARVVFNPESVNFVNPCRRRFLRFRRTAQQRPCYICERLKQAYRGGEAPRASKGYPAPSDRAAMSAMLLRDGNDDDGLDGGGSSAMLGDPSGFIRIPASRGRRRGRDGGGGTRAATGAEGACASEIRSRRATEAARNTTRGRLAACERTGRASRCPIPILYGLLLIKT